MFDVINPASGPVAKDFTLPISRHPGAGSGYCTTRRECALPPAGKSRNRNELFFGKNRTAAPPGCRRRPSRGAAEVARIAPAARVLPSAGRSGPYNSLRKRVNLLSLGSPFGWLADAIAGNKEPLTGRMSRGRLILHPHSWANAA